MQSSPDILDNVQHIHYTNHPRHPSGPQSQQQQQQQQQSSIWAPQPQPSESTWPKAIDSFVRVASDQEMQRAATQNRMAPTNVSVVTREDVFGPVEPAMIGNTRQTMPSTIFKEVGAIGDGRKKTTPEFDDTHVEQLMRTLNLNSPEPCSQKPFLNLSFDSNSPASHNNSFPSSNDGGGSSPDFSPASISSALLTPTDLSPARTLDAKQQQAIQLQQSPCDPYGMPSHSLLFEPNSPTRPGHGHVLIGPNGLTSTNSFHHSLQSQTYSLPSSQSISGPPSSHRSGSPVNPYKTFPDHSRLAMPLGTVQSNTQHSQSSQPIMSHSSVNPSLGLYQNAPLESLQQGMYGQQNPTFALTRNMPYMGNRMGSNTPLHLSGAPPNIGLGLTDWCQPDQAHTLTSDFRNAQGQSNFSGESDWLHAPELDSKPANMAMSLNRDYPQTDNENTGRTRFGSGEGSYFSQASPQQLHSTQLLSPSPNSHMSNEPINFLSLLHPSSSPPYHSFVSRIIKSSDQQASIFLQQKLKVADSAERSKIVDAICARGFEMMAHRFGNWAVQRCLEAASAPDERRKIVACMRGRIVDLATNCYGCHVLQKALDCEEDIRLLIVSELLLGDPAQTLVNKHASHVWSKIMELSWTPPAPPIFAYVNRSLKGKWATLACHETGSLVVQHAFENLEESAKDGIVDELLNQGSGVFSDVVKSQWGSYCIQHILEHGSEQHRQLTLEHLVSGLLDYSTSEQGYKSITKALKEGGKETLDRVITRMCEPAKGARRSMIVDLALSVTGSQLIATVLPTADKDQRATLYEGIRGHIVTLRGCKTGSKVIWLFDRMRAYYGY